MKQPFADLLFETLCHVRDFINPLCGTYGLELSTPLPALDDKAALKKYIAESEFEDDWLLAITYKDRIPEGGFWFGWQLQFGTVHIVTANNCHTFIPLLPFSALTPKEHAQFIVETLISCVNGKIYLETEASNRGPISSRLAGTYINELTFQTSSFSKESQPTDHTITQFANTLPVQTPLSISLTNKVTRQTSKISPSDIVADGLLDFSWWGEDDEDTNTDGSREYTELARSPSAWWLLVLWFFLWFPSLWVGLKVERLQWLAKETPQTFFVITTGLAAITIGLYIEEKATRVSRILRAFEPFTINPIVGIGKAIVYVCRPFFSSKDRTATTFFVIAQSVLSLQYFFDNAIEITTNRLLTFSEMATIHPVVWVFPALQLIALIAFVFKRYYVLNVAIIAYFAIQIWISFGGIYNDNYVSLHGWRAAADNAVSIVAVGLLFYILYAAYVVLAPIFGWAKLALRSKGHVSNALRHPNTMSKNDQKIWLQITKSYSD